MSETERSLSENLSLRLQRSRELLNKTSGVEVQSKYASYFKSIFSTFGMLLQEDDVTSWDCMTIKWRLFDLFFSKESAVKQYVTDERHNWVKLVYDMDLTVKANREAACFILYTLQLKEEQNLKKWRKVKDAVTWSRIERNYLWGRG